MGILDKILGKSEATEATNTSTMAPGQAGAPHVSSQAGHGTHGSHGLATHSPQAPGSDKTVAGLADPQHSYALGHGGELGKSAEHTLTSNFGGAKTGDFGGATDNPRPEFNTNVGIGSTGSGIDGGSGLSGAAAGGIPSGTNKHHDGIAVLGSGNPTGVTSSHPSRQYDHDHTGDSCRHVSHHNHTGADCVHVSHHDHTGDNCRHVSHHNHTGNDCVHVSHHDHTGDNCQHISHGHQSHSYGQQQGVYSTSTTHSHSTGTSTGGGQALFDSAANSDVGGGISGRNKAVGDLGHFKDETNSVPGRAQGGGMDGHGEGYHDRKMGAEMGNFYKGSQPGQ